MNNPVIAEAAQITRLKNQRLMQQGKLNADTKYRIKTPQK